MPIVLRPWIYAVTLTCHATIAAAQLTSGHASEQGPTKESACERSIDRAQSTAGQHQRLARRDSKNLSIRLLDVDDNRQCRRCSSEQFYRNPLVWTCTVRWELAQE